MLSLELRDEFVSLLDLELMVCDRFSLWRGATGGIWRGDVGDIVKACAEAEIDLRESVVER